MIKYRKQILSTLFVALLLFYCGDWLLRGAVFDPLSNARKRTTQLEQRIEKRQSFLSRARQAQSVLAAWQSQSLPSNAVVARSLYQGWLLELVDYVELERPSVNSNPPVTKRGGYRVLSFSAQGRGTLRQLTTFLFEFYRAAHLHQIRSLIITPVPRSDEFDLSVSIEALSLSSADRKDQLCSAVSERLVYEDFAGYEVIVQRNLFGIGGAVDVTEHTQLTGVTYDNGLPEAWFSLQATGETLKLGTGGRLEVGQFVGTITEIIDSDVIVESDGQRWLLTIGENLSEACALPPEY